MNFQYTETKVFLDCFSNRIDWVSKIKSFKVLFVPGLYANSMQWHLNSPKWGRFFEDQISELEKNGIVHQWVQTKTEQKIGVNARIVYDTVKSVTEPVLFFSHSRGCEDVLGALVTYPELRKVVRGWISLQGLFSGSPLSDYLERFKLDGIYGDFLKSLGGSKDVIHELSTRHSKSYLKKVDSEIRELCNLFPVLTVGTYLPLRIQFRSDSFLRPTRDLLSLCGYKNDGIVNSESSLLPYSRRIVLKDLDHIETVIRNPYRQVDRTKLTRALFSQLFN